MVYLKATVIGVLVGFLAAALWHAGTLYWLEAHHPGPFHVLVNARPMLLAAFIGFVLGFLWTVRRARASN